MKLIKRWKAYLVGLLSFFCIAGCFLTVHADSIDSDYAYKIQKLDLVNQYFSNTLFVDKIKMDSLEISDYDKTECRVESNNNTSKIYAGKITIHVSTNEADGTYYFPQLGEGEKYQIETPAGIKYQQKKEEKKGKLSDSSGQLQLTPSTNDIFIGAWTDTDGQTYETYYDLAIVNTSDQYIMSNSLYLNTSESYTKQIDTSYSKIIFSCDYNLGTVLNVSIKPVFRKKIEIKDEKPYTKIEISNDGINRLVDVNFETGDRKINVYNEDRSQSKEYEIHLNMPWKVNIPESSQRNYVIEGIEYTDIFGDEWIYPNDDYGSAEDNIDYIEVPAGNTIKFTINNKNDRTKVLKDVSFINTSAGPGIAPEVTIDRNTISFKMPTGVVNFGYNFTFDEASSPSYTLTGEAEKTNDNLLSMGRVSFTNEAGENVFSAKQNEKITVAAIPTNDPAYEFEFTEWTATGITLSDEQKKSSTISITVNNENIKLVAGFKKVGVNVTVQSENYEQGQVAILYPNGYTRTTYGVTKNAEFTDTVKKGARISFAVFDSPKLKICSRWKVMENGIDITESIPESDWTEKQLDYRKYKSPFISVNNDITVTAFFSDRDGNNVSVSAVPPDMGTVSIVGGTYQYKDDPVVITAKPENNLYIFEEWKVISPENKINLMNSTTEDDRKNNITRTQFFMIDEPVEIQAVFRKAVLSSDNSITEIILKDQQQNQYITDNRGGNNYTVELSSDKTKAEVQQLLSGNFTLTLEIPEYATAAFGDDENYHDKAAWETGISVSGFELNQAKSIKVKAENGDIREYTLKFTWTANGEKAISALQLFDQEQSLGTGTLDQNGTDWIVTLSQDLTQKQVNDLIAKNLKLKLTIPSRATAKFGDGSTCGSADWNAGQPVRITGLDSPHVITVTAEDDTTVTYNLIVKWTAKGDKDLTAVTLQDSQKNDLGTGVATGTAWTVTLSQNLTQAEVDNLFKAGFYLKLTISDRAKAALEGAAGSTKEAWANGVKVGILKLNEAKKLTVTAEDGSTKEYTIKVAWSPKPTSKEKELTGVELLDKDKKVIAAGTLEGTAWTVEIPEDKYTKQQASNLANGGAYLKLTASEGATIAQKDGYDEKGQESWSSGNISTNMTLNREYTFIVTAENGSTKEYTIMLSYPTEKPVLKAGTVTRSSDKEAKAVFNSTLAGKYYWEIVEKGAKEPTIDTSYVGSTAKKGNNTVTLTSLEAGAKDLYIVVKSSDGEVSDLLKMEIPAYDAAAEEYAITLSYPTSGGTLKASASKAKAGDKITITVTPKTGYKLTPGTLKYSEASSTGAVVNIDETTGTFTMPASEISISCTWTAESTDQPETTTGKIGAFVVNGVSGTVDNTTGTITVTLPNGTDLTSLAPVITISGAKSISPASGATVNLSSPVTYTLTLEDGTTKTYTVRAYVEGPSKSDQLWNDMLNNVDGSPDHSGSKTWWKKAKDLKKHNDYPEYW